MRARLAKISRCTLIALSLFSSHSLILAADDSLRTYTNGRFGFLLRYPAQLIPGREPTNGAGRTFATHDQAFTVSVWGYLPGDRDVESNQTWKEVFDREYNDTLRTHSNVTYQRKTGHWFVVSGNQDGKEFYFKLFYRGEQRDLVAIDIVYPHARTQEFDPWVEKIITNFQPLLDGGDYE